MITENEYRELSDSLEKKDVKLIAVSKRQLSEKVQKMISYGHQEFGENHAQALNDRITEFGSDPLKWHFIGHLQSNKVKTVVGKAVLIHGADSERLLREINKQSAKKNLIQAVLLQVHIAKEDTKFGFAEEDLLKLFDSGIHREWSNIRIDGLMGMATNTTDFVQVGSEFRKLRLLFEKIKQQYFNSNQHFNEISMGMSSDFKIAINEGSTMVRLGSSLFGPRDY